MRPIAIVLPALAALFSILRTASAHADAPAPRTSSLSWIRLAGTEECISTQALAQSVEQRLGRAAFVSAATADVSVEGRVEKNAAGWRAVVVVRDRDGKQLGTRELASREKTCDALNEPLALVIAVMIDPDAALGGSAGPATTVPPPLPPPLPPPPKVIVEKVYIHDAPREPPARRDTWRLDGGVGLVTSVGLLPFPNIGGTIGGILTPPGFIGLEGYGAYFLESTADAERGASARLALVYAGGGLCPIAHHAPRIHFALCLGGQIGLLRSRGVGFAVAQDEDQIVLNLAGDGHVSFPIQGPFALRAGGQFIVPLRRDRFAYAIADGSTREVFRMAPVGIVAEIGIGADFP